MRWSQILPHLVSILSIYSFVSLAVVTPSNLVELETRTSAKYHSKKYRKAAAEAPQKYIVAQSNVHVEDLDPADRESYGQASLKNPDLHADHIFEVQMFNNHLRKNGVQSLDDLPSHMHDKVRKILNAKEGMAFIRGDINMAKGQSVRKGLAKKEQLKVNPLRDSYMAQSYPAAIKTARRLDDLFRKEPQHKHLAGFENTLHSTMETLKIPIPGTGPRRSQRLRQLRDKSVTKHALRANKLHQSPRLSGKGARTRT